VNRRFLIMAAGFALMGATDAPQLSALSAIEGGQWVLRSMAPGTPPRTICLGDPRALLQIQHPAGQCTRFVITNYPRTATIHYTCAGTSTGNGAAAGAGHGWTTVRVETPRLIHVDSQGIANNAPFDWSLEGRRAGPCPGTARR
jgi:hypothetical protein